MSKERRTAPAIDEAAAEELRAWMLQRFVQRQTETMLQRFAERQTETEPPRPTPPPADDEPKE